MVSNTLDNLPQRSDIDTHSQNLSVRVVATDVVHGSLTPSGDNASLIIFEFNFVGQQAKRRIKSAAFTVRFGNSENVPMRDPEVLGFAPQGSYRLFPTEATKTTGMRADFSIGGTGAQWHKERTITEQFGLTIVGVARVVDRDFGAPNAVLWVLEENEHQKSGISISFRTAILLKRPTDHKFKAFCQIQTKVDWGSFISNFGSGTKEQPVDPMIFDPNMPPKTTLKFDASNLGEVKLSSLMRIAELQKPIASARPQEPPSQKLPPQELPPQEPSPEKPSPEEPPPPTDNLPPEAPPPKEPLPQRPSTDEPSPEEPSPEEPSLEKPSLEEPSRQKPSRRKLPPSTSLHEVSSDESSSEDQASEESSSEEPKPQRLVPRKRGSQDTLLHEVDSWSESTKKDQILFDFSKGIYSAASYKFRVFETLSLLNLYNYQDRLVHLDKKIRTEIDRDGKMSKKHKRHLAKLLRKYHEAIQAFKDLATLQKLPIDDASFTHAFLEFKLNNSKYAPEKDDMAMCDLKAEPSPDAVRSMVQGLLDRVQGNGAASSFEDLLRPDMSIIDNDNFRIFKHPPPPPPANISPTANKFSRFFVAALGGVFLLAPMCELTYVKPVKYQLISVVLWVLFFGFALAAASGKATNQELLLATAAYAAVLVVFISKA